MQARKSLIAVLILFVFAVGLFAGRQLVKMGNTNSPSMPETTESYTLEDVYNRLDKGAPGTATSFVEPASGPDTGTMHTIDDIMELAGTACTQCNPPSELSENYRWCDNKDGTVTDMSTGLIWLKKADWGGAQAWDDLLGNQPARDRVKILGAELASAELSDGSEAGDWRLPTRRELNTLGNGTEPVRASNPRFFTGLPGESSFEYWSNTPYAEDADRAWFARPMQGTSNHAPVNMTFEVWPVRSKTP